ncbi:hypothetical protein [Streptomyces syringium]|uniref:hypothetical protein n=1 Tax=Streptomyces syringium TaxID=76729 RepID=UPI0033A8F8DB
MTSLDRTPKTDLPSVRPLAWVTTVAGLLSIVAVIVLALTGYTAAATAVGLIGGALAGGIQVTVQIRR